MKKEFYKLSLVFIMIVFSFSLAFFLGREVTLSGEKQKEESSSLQEKKLDNKTLHVESPFKEEEKVQMQSENENEKVDEHEQALLRTKATEDEESEKKADTKSENKEEVDAKVEKKADQAKDSTEESNVLYGLLIDSYDEKQSAAEKAAQLKLRFPKWKILFKKSKDLYKVYIGPFIQKETAENFLKEIQKKPDFSSVKMEQI